MDDLTQFFGDMFAAFRTRGMKLPWLMATIGINGSALVMHITDDGAGGLKFETLAEHYFDNAMKLPINIMTVDATGEAVRTLITPKGMTFH